DVGVTKEEGSLVKNVEDIGAELGTDPLRNLGPLGHRQVPGVTRRTVKLQALHVAERAWLWVKEHLTREGRGIIQRIEAGATGAAWSVHRADRRSVSVGIEDGGVDPVQRSVDVKYPKQALHLVSGQSCKGSFAGRAAAAVEGAEPGQNGEWSATLP